jgi:hypothetical protein
MLVHVPRLVSYQAFWRTTPFSIRELQKYRSTFCIPVSRPLWIGNFVTLVTIHPPRAPRSRMRRRAPTRTPRLRVRVVWARGRRPRAGARWDAIWLGTSSELETTEPECLTGSTRCWGTCSQCGRQLGMLYHYWRRNNKFTLLPWLGMRYHQRVASL